MLFTGGSNNDVKQTHEVSKKKHKPNHINFTVNSNTDTFTTTTTVPVRTISKSRFTRAENINKPDTNVRRMSKSSSINRNFSMDKTIQQSIKNELHKQISDISTSHQDTIRELESKIEVVTRENQQYRHQELKKAHEIERKLSQSLQPRVESSALTQTAVENIIKSHGSQYALKDDLQKNTQQMLSQQEYSNELNKELKKRMDDFMRLSQHKSEEEKKQIQGFIEKIIQEKIKQVSTSNTQQYDVERIVQDWIVKMQPASMNKDVVERIIKENLQIHKEAIDARTKDIVLKADLDARTKDIVLKADLDARTKDIVSKADLDARTKDIVLKADLDARTKDIVSKADLDARTKDMTNVTSMENIATKSELETHIKNMANMATKNDLEAHAKNMANMATKNDLEAHAKNMANMATKNDLEAHAKNVATNLENQKQDILRVVDEKFRVLDMKDLTQKYLTDMITKGEKSDHEDKDACHTTFEEIIEPAVARIIFRVMKYDRPHEQNEINSPTNSQDEAHLDFGDVYETNHSPLIDNPIYDAPNVPENTLLEEAIVDLGSVYKDEGPGMFKNELREMKENKWKKIGRGGIDSGNVIDIFMDKKNKKIYIAGHFKHINKVPTENIAVYDMNAKTWKHVGEGIPQIASSLAVDEENEHVYVGGIFTKVGKGPTEVNANNVAMYSVKENKWYPLGDGLNRECNTIVFDPSDKKLYACGSFTKSGMKDVRYVGVYDINTKTWSPLEGGSVNATCRILIQSQKNSELYLGGLFTSANDESICLSYIAKYNLKTKEWHNLSGGLQGYCNTMTIDEEKNTLYVGGTFTSVGENETSLDAHHIASYNLTTHKWDDMEGGVNNVVQSIYFDIKSYSLFIGGTFTNTYEDDRTLNCIARFDLKTSKWHSLENYHSEAKNKEEMDESRTGLDGACKVVSMDNKSLIIAGKFENAGNISVNSIARYALERS